MFTKPLLLYFILLSYASISLVSTVSLFDAQINLVNTSPNQALRVHCNNNGQDLGTATIPDHSPAYSFATHVLVRQKTVATCSMQLGNLHGENYVVFDWDRDKNRCDNKVCVWQINEKGLFLLINNDDYVLIYHWR